MPAWSNESDYAVSIDGSTRRDHISSSSGNLSCSDNAKVKMESPYSEDVLRVFAYGSLMWRPGFSYEDSCPATVLGYHRSLCVFSVVHRGTPTKPGLILGLDAGGQCRGVCFTVGLHQAESTLDYLRKREQATLVYIERFVTVQLQDGNSVQAIAFVADRSHQQYAGKLSLDQQESIARSATGESGCNVDYIINTHNHLLSIGVCHRGLQSLVHRLSPLGIVTQCATPQNGSLFFEEEGDSELENTNKVKLGANARSKGK